MNKLKELRQELGWTQEQLAEKLNVKKSAISKYENERVPLIDETILKLCNIFDVSADYFLGNTDIKNKSKFSKEAEGVINSLLKLNNEELKKVSEYIEFLVSKRN